MVGLPIEGEKFVETDQREELKRPRVMITNRVTGTEKSPVKRPTRGTRTGDTRPSRTRYTGWPVYGPRSCRRTKNHDDRDRKMSSTRRNG